MAKKKDKKDAVGVAFLFGAIGLAIFSIFLINTRLVFNKFSRKYPLDRADRVSDTGNFLRYLPIIVGVSVLGGLFAFIFVSIFTNRELGMLQRVILSAITAVPAGFCLLAFYALSARLATTQIGMLIFKNNGIFVIPADPNKNTFSENIFNGRLYWDMFAMEELPLKGIYKITREYGKRAFVHGSFGTRNIKWRNKQKRDECIAALEMACGKKLSSFDLGK